MCPQVPIGDRVQVGAFLDAASAKTLVEKLKAQGVEATVYKP
ncbi:MAG: SPOR domain-containing protein [Coleofasciculaceae cyanobacterium SM2_3_26]|nr:SPOR domain-containing protein [Coleofasciculaceae cyanobacterium SM2_3_26]